MVGRRVREHFGSYGKEAYVDEARLRVQIGTGLARALCSPRVLLSVGIATGATGAALTASCLRRPWDPL